MMDKMRRCRAELYRSMDILNTESVRLEKILDLLQKSVQIMPEEMKQEFEEQARRARKIAEDAEEVKEVILEIAESNGSEEAIQKAERLYKRLDEDR